MVNSINLFVEDLLQEKMELKFIQKMAKLFVFGYWHSLLIDK